MITSGLKPQQRWVNPLAENNNNNDREGRDSHDPMDIEEYNYGRVLIVSFQAGSTIVLISSVHPWNLG